MGKIWDWFCGPSLLWILCGMQLRQLDTGWDWTAASLAFAWVVIAVSSGERDERRRRMKTIAETVERMEKMRRRRRADGGPQTADVPETINRP